MSIGALDATSAYGRALGIGKDSGGLLGKAGGVGASAGAGGFGDMVEHLVGDRIILSLIHVYLSRREEPCRSQ